MTFYWVDLLQFVILAGMIYLAYRFYRADKKTHCAVVVAIGLLFFFLSPTNFTEDGFGSVEVQRSEVEVKPLPERITVPKEPSFEERVKEDIEEYKKERENDDNQ